MRFDQQIVADGGAEALRLGELDRRQLAELGARTVMLYPARTFMSLLGVTIRLTPGTGSVLLMIVVVLNLTFAGSTS